jgi:hypothetical protein
MDVAALQHHTTQATSPFQQTTSNPADFGNSFMDAVGNGGDDAVQQFMDYAKETPAQRMFDNWLEGQHITQAEYDSMSQAQKQKLLDQYQLQLKQEMMGGMGGSTATTAASLSIA